MLITVTQKIPDNKTQWAQVNTDLVERVRENPDGSLSVSLQSGFTIEIVENWHWWEEHAKS
jgi:hypothetical protein